jgi:hypothetical protein
VTRREFAALLGASAFAAPGGRGLALNEDPNHFFVNRRKQRLTRDLIAAWVPQYANTQVRELILCVNAMRSAFASKTRESFWTGFDPARGPDQEFLASMPDPKARQVWFDWIRCAWQMERDGLDLYSIWIPEIRRQRISPWISVRMNDLHDVDNERHPLHSSFWKQHPQFRRVPYRSEQRDKALDYSRAEVRAHYFSFLEEVCERYDFDTLELDWMRHGFHFRPGFEAEGQKTLNTFHNEVRALLNTWSRKRKHPIGLAVRVPGSPQTARLLGLDPIDWPVDFVTPTNYWRTVDTAMPIETWRRLLPRNVTLAAGLELGLNAFVGSVAAGGRAWQSNSLETVRGAAAAYLHQGADRIYLFNYMDSDTTLDDPSGYAPLLRECGELATLAGKTRRHVVTYQDTWAPGESPVAALPVDLAPQRWRAFRLSSGPYDAKLRAMVWLGITDSGAKVQVRCNGEICARLERAESRKPGPNTACVSFAVPHWRGGDSVVEVTAESAARLEWVEIELRA